MISKNLLSEILNVEINEFDIKDSHIIVFYNFDKITRIDFNELIGLLKKWLNIQSNLNFSISENKKAYGENYYYAFYIGVAIDFDGSVECNYLTTNHLEKSKELIIRICEWAYNKILYYKNNRS